MTQQFIEFRHPGGDRYRVKADGNGLTIVKNANHVGGGTVLHDFGKLVQDAPVVTEAVTVDASGGGSGETTNVTEVPASSILLNVQAVVDTPFDGDTTQDFEVGVSGNADNYIDTSDFDPSASAGTNAGSLSGSTNDQTTPEWIGSDTQLIATWTNTASASAGEVTVYTTYINLA